VSRPRPPRRLLAAALLLSAAATGAYCFQPEPRDAGSWSPLFARRLELGVGAMDRVQAPDVRMAYQIVNQPDETVLSLNPVSFCAGSACLGSFCGGSACLLSKCMGSACANSTCVGSGCAVSACVGSACGTSLCVGSVCLGSACVGSSCLTCATGEVPQDASRG
jgi:hypothetical protein